MNNEYFVRVSPAWLDKLDERELVM